MHLRTIWHKAQKAAVIRACWAAIALLGFSGLAVSETRQAVRNLDAFSVMEIHLAGDFVIRPAKTYRATISIAGESPEVIGTHVVDGRLTLDSTVPSIQTSHLSIVVESPELHELDFRGSGSVLFEGPVQDSFRLLEDASGSIAIRNIDVAELDVAQQGASDLSLSGKADRARIHLNGAGSFQADKLEIDACHVQVDGVGDVSLNCRKELQISGMGVGSIRVSGSPIVHNLSDDAIDVELIN